jgi:drug/metabolite transporter (DMT)-like permease
VPDCVPISDPEPVDRARSVSMSAGVLLGVLAAFGQGTGVVLAKAGMVEMPVVAASFLRLASAALGLFVLAAALRQFDRLGRLLRAKAMITRVVPATLLGTYLALFLMMLGIALAPAAIAATLLSVSPIYGLFIDAVVNRQKITARGIVGTLLAVAGVAILTHG